MFNWREILLEDGYRIKVIIDKHTVLPIHNSPDTPLLCRADYNRPDRVLLLLFRPMPSHLSVACFGHYCSIQHRCWRYSNILDFEINVTVHPHFHLGLMPSINMFFSGFANSLWRKFVEKHIRLSSFPLRQSSFVVYRLEFDVLKCCKSRSLALHSDEITRSRSFCRRVVQCAVTFFRW